MGSMAALRVLRIRVSSRRIVKADLLQFWNRRNDAGGQHDAVDEMVGELGRHRLVRGVIRIFARSDEFCSDLPDRVMASQEDDAACLQRRNGIALRPEHALWVL